MALEESETAFKASLHLVVRLHQLQRALLVAHASALEVEAVGKAAVVWRLGRQGGQVFKIKVNGVDGDGVLARVVLQHAGHEGLPPRARHAHTRRGERWGARRVWVSSVVLRIWQISNSAIAVQKNPTNSQLGTMLKSPCAG